MSARTDEHRQPGPGYQSRHYPYPRSGLAPPASTGSTNCQSWDVFQSTTAQAPLPSARLTLQNGTSILTGIIDDSSAGDGPHPLAARPSRPTHRNIGQLLSNAVPGFSARRPGMAASRSPGAACPAASTANHHPRGNWAERPCTDIRSEEHPRASSQPLPLDNPHHMPLVNFSPNSLPSEPELHVSALSNRVPEISLRDGDGGGGQGMEGSPSFIFLPMCPAGDGLPTSSAAATTCFVTAAAYSRVARSSSARTAWPVCPSPCTASQSKRKSLSPPVDISITYSVLARAVCGCV